MPSSVTHAYFAKDVRKKLERKIKVKFEVDTFITFSKGPDVFYNQFFHVTQRLSTRKFGYLLHHENTKKFFVEYVHHIQKLHLEKNREVIGSLYGMVSHYYLDQLTHPLVYYQTNHDAVKHREMELLIDLYMLEKRERKKPASIVLSQMLFPKLAYSPQLKNLLNSVYQNVYLKDNMGTLYLSSLKQMYYSFKYLRYDPYGHKQKIYQILAHFHPKVEGMVYLSYAADLRAKVDYINFEHKTWCNPADQSLTSADSFFDLYDKALEKTCHTISLMHEVLYGTKELKDLEKALSNTSCFTNLDCTDPRKMKYFRDDSCKK